MNSSFSTSSPPVKTVTSTIPSRIVGTSTSESIATPTNSASVGISWTWDFHTTAEPKGPYAVNAEKMRFCLMFVVWPALVGLSMSL
ncbi:hypothetical protein BDN70DRAFT_875921 [Pholiota conissans]|uniref:Uncharacterized protein n=1 Tax=Pholiota conissans TaxID=109636 RepID=A0A9P5Z5H7_9AGAR|nr:hypothetical protein BDN70DRAFT_875921 [Pholiota conissans]